jgi:uncharacterized membrane protein (DUF373 family)
MKNHDTLMLIASFMGALIGIYYNVAANPFNNYFIFAALFAMAGVAAANLMLLVLVELYEWLIRNRPETEKTQNPQTT